MSKEPVKQRPRNPNGKPQNINPGPLSIVGYRKKLSDRASRGPFPPAEDSEGPAPRAKGSDGTAQVAKSSDDTFPPVEDSDGPGQLAEDSDVLVSPAEVDAGVPEEPGDVSGTSPEAFSGTSGYPKKIVFAPPAGMVEGLEAGLKRVLDEQRGGSETVTVEEPPNTETTQFLKLTFPSWNDRVRRDPTYKFTEEYLKKFFEILPKFVDALNVRLMAELIASVGEGRAEGVAGGKTAFEVPDIFVSIDCRLVEKSKPPGEESEPPVEQSKPPGEESKTHVVRVVLHSGTKLVYTHGPEPNQWALEIPKGTGIPDGSQSGGAGTSSLTGFFRKGVAYLGLLVESCLHTANHMARRRAEETFFALLPDEFHTEEYARHWPPCIGIIEASVLKEVETSGRFAWNGDSIPYKARGLSIAVLERAYTEFRAFDIDTFLVTRRPQVFPLYKLLYKSADSVAESVASRVEPLVYLADNQARNSWFEYANIAIPDPRAGTDDRASKYTFTLEPFDGPYNMSVNIKIFRYKSIAEKVLQIYILGYYPLLDSTRDVVDKFKQVSTRMYELANANGAYDTESSNTIEEYINAKNTMVTTFQTEGVFSIIEPGIFSRDYGTLLDTLDMPPNDESIALRETLVTFLKRVYISMDNKRNRMNFQLLEHPTSILRFPSAIRNPSIMQIVTVLTPRLLIEGGVLVNLPHDTSFFLDIIRTVLSVDIFPEKQESNDRVGDVFAYISDLLDIFKSSYAKDPYFSNDETIKPTPDVTHFLESTLREKQAGNRETITYITAAYIAIIMCAKKDLNEYIDVEVIRQIVNVLQKFESIGNIETNTNLLLFSSTPINFQLKISIRDFLTHRFRATRTQNVHERFDKGELLPSGWVDVSPGEARSLIEFEEEYVGYIESLHTETPNSESPPESLLEKLQLLNASVKITYTTSFILDRLKVNTRIRERLPGKYFNDDTLRDPQKLLGIIMVLTPSLVKGQSHAYDLSHDDARRMIEIALLIDVFPGNSTSKVLGYLSEIRECIFEFSLAGLHTDFFRSYVIQMLIVNTSGNNLDPNALLKAGYIALVLSSSKGLDTVLDYKELENVRGVYTHLLKNGVTSEFIEANTNLNPGILVSALQIEAQISLSEFLTKRIIFDDDGTRVSIGDALPDNWISKNILFVQGFSGGVLTLTRSLIKYAANEDYVITPKSIRNTRFINMAKEMHEYYKGVRDIGDRLVIDPSIALSKHTKLQAERICVEFGTKSACLIGFNCLDGYEYPVEPDSDKSRTIEPELFYFAAAEFRQGSPVTSCMCAAHILLSLHSDDGKIKSTYSESLYSKVQTGTDDIPCYVTIKGSASYVREQILERVDWEDKEKSPDVQDSATPHSGRGIPDVAFIISDVTNLPYSRNNSREYRQNINPNEVPPLSDDTIPGAVNRGGGGAVSRGTAVASGGGGSPGPSGLSALTIAFLGAVTFAAAFCRRP